MLKNIHTFDGERYYTAEFFTKYQCISAQHPKSQFDKAPYTHGF